MIHLLRQRLESYAVTNALQEEHALKEILQEVVLYALWRVDFFSVAAFQGGTALRILHKLPRFSEDLDFILIEPNSAFQWAPYLSSLTEVLSEFGIACELIDRNQMDKAVRQAMLKDDSIGKQLNLAFFRGDTGRKLKVKLEIDTHPPAGSHFDYRYLDFPLDFEICAQDLPSNFALKIHALLCRPYMKGRDWFDFGWYIKHTVQPNIQLLAAALTQAGPWANQQLTIDLNWLEKNLKEKISAIDWAVAIRDVEPFLLPMEQTSLRLWSERFFTDKLEKLIILNR